MNNYAVLSNEQVEQHGVAEACAAAEWVQAPTGDYSLCVVNVPGLGHVTTGADYGGAWDLLLCPPGVTTVAQVVADIEQGVA